MSASMTERKVRDQIESAFAQSQYPGDHKLVHHEQDWEGAPIKALFRGKHWREVSLDLLLSHTECIWHLTPEAFRFYVPAFLLASLDDDPDTVYESTLYSLTPPPRGIGSQEEFNDRVQGFDVAQGRAIKAALEFYRSGYDDADAAGSLPSHALEDYWNEAIFSDEG